MAYRQDWERLIRAYSPRFGLDPHAMVSVAMSEGLSGRVGDNGSSFGPFQLHVGGALPQGKGRGWAESRAGIIYALQQAAAAGARGKKGQAAISAMVRNFERPADPSGEIARALGYYKGMGGRGAPGGSGLGAPMAAPPLGSLGGMPLPSSMGGNDALRMQLLSALRQRTQAYLSNSSVPSLSMIPGLAQGFMPQPLPMPALPPMPTLAGLGIPVNGRIRGQTSLGPGAPRVQVSGKVTPRVNTMMTLAREYLATPYSWGGGGPKGPSKGFGRGANTVGFDCSSFLQFLNAKVGVNIPRTTYTQWRAGSAVPRNKLAAGDAVFFHPGSQGPEHVGIYIGGGRFIEAPHTGAKVRVSKLAGRKDYMGARRYTK